MRYGAVARRDSDSSSDGHRSKPVTCNGAYTYHIWLETPGAQVVSVTGTVPDPVPADTQDPGAAAALSWR